MGKQKQPRAGKSPSGVVFSCNKQTERTCIENYVFGAPLTQHELVNSIELGTPLFLFNSSSRVLLGEWIAESKGGITPRVLFGRDNRANINFPCQVLVGRVNDFAPLKEQQFRNILTVRKQHNGTNFYQFVLSTDQVDKLRKCFQKNSRTRACTLQPLRNAQPLPNGRRQRCKDVQDAPTDLQRQVTPRPNDEPSPSGMMANGDGRAGPSIPGRKLAVKHTVEDAAHDDQEGAAELHLTTVDTPADSAVRIQVSGDSQGSNQVSSQGGRKRGLDKTNKSPGENRKGKEPEARDDSTDAVAREVGEAGVATPAHELQQGQEAVAGKVAGAKAEGQPGASSEEAQRLSAEQDPDAQQNAARLGTLQSEQGQDGGLAVTVKRKGAKGKADKDGGNQPIIQLLEFPAHLELQSGPNGNAKIQPLEFPAHLLKRQTPRKEAKTEPLEFPTHLLKRSTPRRSSDLNQRGPTDVFRQISVPEKRGGPPRQLRSPLQNPRIERRQTSFGIAEYDDNRQSGGYDRGYERPRSLSPRRAIRPRSPESVWRKYDRDVPHERRVLLARDGNNYVERGWDELLPPLKRRVVEREEGRGYISRQGPNKSKWGDHDGGRTTRMYPQRDDEQRDAWPLAKRRLQSLHYRTDRWSSQDYRERNTHPRPTGMEDGQGPFDRTWSPPAVPAIRGTSQNFHQADKPSVEAGYLTRLQMPPVIQNLSRAQNTMPPYQVVELRPLAQAPQAQQSVQPVVNVNAGLLQQPQQQLHVPAQQGTAMLKPVQAGGQVPQHPLHQHSMQQVLAQPTAMQPAVLPGTAQLGFFPYNPIVHEVLQQGVVQPQQVLPLAAAQQPAIPAMQSAQALPQVNLVNAIQAFQQPLPAPQRRLGKGIAFAPEGNVASYVPPGHVFTEGLPTSQQRQGIE